MPTLSGNSWHYSAQECQDNAEYGIQNLLSLYAQATRSEIAKGKEWYPKAREAAQEISDLYGIPLDTVIQVAAAISPRCPWEVNMDSAAWVVREYLSGCYVPSYDDYVAKRVYLANVPNVDPNKIILAQDPRVSAPPYGGLKANVIKALWILQGHDCLSGPKVNDFYQCVKHWETFLGACVDSHAIQGWFANYVGGTYGIPPSFYKIIRADYIQAAEMVGLAPLQFQAILWLVKKRISKKKGKK